MGFLKTLKELKRAKPSNGPTIKVCPDCLQPTLREEFNVSGWLSQSSYQCTNCGYVGNFFVEITQDELEQLKKNLESNNPEEKNPENHTIKEDQ